MKFRKEINEANMLHNCVFARGLWRKYLLDDEIFVKVQNYQNIYVSNYGRVVEYIDKLSFKTIHQDESKKNNRYHYVRLGKDYTKEYVHKLVAYAFCNIPNNPDNEELQVHHIQKFNPRKANNINNRADNLMIVKKSHHKTLDCIREIRTTYLPSVEMDFETGILKHPPERKTFYNILDACDYLKLDLDDFIYLILKKKPKYIGEVAESRIYKRYLINIVKYKPRVNKHLIIVPGQEVHMTLDRW